MPFTISTHRDRYLTVLCLAGELDMQPAAELKELFDRLVDGGHRHVVLDLHRLTFCDSLGLSALIHGYRVCRADGGSLRVRGDTGTVRRVLSVTGVRDLLTEESDATSSGCGNSR
jgi:anti-sigma B factor antagonist